MVSSNEGQRAYHGFKMVEPGEVGISPERLGRLAPVMQRHIDAQRLPGVVTLVARHGCIVHIGAQGWQEVETGTPMSTETIFRIASMTKPVTAVAVSMLCEEGSLNLDDPIARFLPAFKEPYVRAPWGRAVSVGLDRSRGTSRAATTAAVREITIRDCLTNTAGFDPERFWQLVMGRSPEQLTRPYWLTMRAAQQGKIEPPSPPRTSAELVDRLARLPLIAQPGSEWLYHPGFEVAGVLVEAVSGQPLPEFLEKRIFAPLGMRDTAFHVPQEKVSRLAAAYYRDGSADNFELFEAAATSRLAGGPREYRSGAMGLLSTAGDYARFAQMLLNGGELDGTRILGRKTVELMTANHTGDLPIYILGPGYGYGLGVFVVKDLIARPKLGSLGQFGWGGAHGTWFFVDPKEDLFGLYLVQLLGQQESFDLRAISDFEKIVYQALAD